MLACLAVAACSDRSDSGNLSTLTDKELAELPTAKVDFIGELVKADLLSEWGMEAIVALPTTLGGPESDYVAGPAVFTLASGQIVEVPVNTPGSDSCDMINPNHDFSSGLVGVA